MDHMIPGLVEEKDQGKENLRFLLIELFFYDYPNPNFVFLVENHNFLFCQINFNSNRFRCFRMVFDDWDVMF
jgi:hypothetical protein